MRAECLFALSVIAASFSICHCAEHISGCKDFLSTDDLTNRVTKKSTLKKVEDLIAKSRILQEAQNSNDCGDLTFPSLNINVRDFEDHARLAVRNGQILTNVVSSYPSSDIPDLRPVYPMNNPLNTLMSSGCGTQANPLQGGNPILSSLTLSTLVSSKEIFAAGSCQGTGPSSTSVCHYRFRLQNAAKTKVLGLYDTALDFGEFPILGEKWFTLPQGIVAEVNHSWVTTRSVEGLSIPTTIRQTRIGSRTTHQVTFGYTSNLWTDPYFDCFLGYIWMITYSAPIVHVTDNNEIQYVGMAGVDINLSDIDLNECDVDQGAEKSAFDAFRNTHLCEPVSTQCKIIPGKGFTFGSYKCQCRPGFYLKSPSGADLPLSSQFFEGQKIENRVANIRGNRSCNCTATEECLKETEEIRDVLQGEFMCLKCPEGCDTCTTGREVCSVQTSAALVAALSSVNVISILVFVGLMVVVVLNRQSRVIRSASWPFLITTLIGSIFAVTAITLQAFAGGFTQLDITKPLCILSPWLYYLGFSLTYGSILVKTWRLHQIFSTRRFRGKGRSRLSNMDLTMLLLAITFACIVLLLFWTFGIPPAPKRYETSSGLKFWRCSTSFVDVVMEIITLFFLLPVVYLSFQLRNITDDFSETKEIHVSAYIFLVVKIISLVVSNVFTLTPAVFYLLQFLIVQFSFTAVAIIFFVRKISKLTAEGNESLPANSAFVLNKKKPSLGDRGVSVLSLDDAHRRVSTGGLEGNEKIGQHDINYLPAVSEEKIVQVPVVTRLIGEGNESCEHESQDEALSEDVDKESQEIIDSVSNKEQMVV